MIFLSSTTELLQVVTGSAGSVDVHASWADVVVATPSITYGDTNTAITTAATTTIVSSPAASTVRNIRHVSIRNSSTTVQNVVSVRHFNGTIGVLSISMTLLPGDQLHYDEGDGWQYIPATASVQTPGRLLKTTVLTSGTTFTTTANTNTLRLRMVGGGGGGGGCSSVAAAAAAAGGGGSGAYTEKLIAVTPNTNYTYAIGAAGPGVSGAAGTNGGSTTFTVGATSVTAPGGTGGPLATAATSATAYLGGAGGVAGANGDISIAGEPGLPGVMISVSPTVASGAGGSSPFGAGGAPLGAVGNGSNATGNGGGGGGSATGASTVRTGGNGSAGMVIVDEYS